MGWRRQVFVLLGSVSGTEILQVYSVSFRLHGVSRGAIGNLNAESRSDENAEVAKD